MVVRKILETTLSSGQTSVIFTDSDIPNSLLRVYTTKSDLFPVTQVLSGTSLTVTYEAQETNIGVALEIVKQGLDIVDNLTSSDADKALSAKQGKVIKDALDAIPDPPENITDLNDVSVTSIQDGQVLAWDEVEEKFVNVNQSGGSSIDVYDFEWLATSSSAEKTALTETKSLPAGKYIAIVHTPYGTNVNGYQFMLLDDNEYIYQTSVITNSSYNSITMFFNLNSTSDVKLASATVASVTWDAQYISEGCMRIIKVGDI